MTEIAVLYGRSVVGVGTQYFEQQKKDFVDFILL